MVAILVDVVVGGQVLHERFTVEGVLARSGLATVYRAHDSLLRRTVALKVFDRLIDLTGYERARFIRKAQILARLGHPNVVRLYDASFAGRMPYLVLEYVDGEDLRCWVAASSAPPDWETLRFIAVGVLEALAHAHVKQIIHRDVKPENVLVTTDPTDRGRIQSVKLGDFGLARLVGTSPLTRASDVASMGGYLAPECVRGEPHSIRSDLYAVGALLYELAAGCLPFTGGAFEEPSSSPAHLRMLRPDLPSRFDEIVMQLLERDPRVRPASAESVVRALAAIDVHDRASPRRGVAARTIGWRKDRLEPATDSEPAENIVRFPSSRALRALTNSSSVRKARNR